jgi:thioredoxin reductase/Pyruvate/2-oxoacid:ferredoxin oxidoreductase delta subunit
MEAASGADARTPPIFSRVGRSLPARLAPIREETGALEAGTNVAADRGWGEGVSRTPRGVLHADREARPLNVFVVLGVFAILIALLALLSDWQRRIAELHREKVVAEIREAERLGTEKPVAQHPQIDVQACIGCGSCIAACPEDEVLALVDGVARVVHGSRCVGHGLCAVACPVAAVKIGLGDIALRPDIPVLSGRLETSVPGVYIAGELGGFALIRNAVAQGIQAVDEIAAEIGAAGGRRRRDHAPDLLIVGAGPAGLGATLRAMERGLSHVTIDQDDIVGTVRKYPRRKLTLTGPLVLPLHGRVSRSEFLKEELIEFLEKDIIARFGVEIRTGVKLAGLEPIPGGIRAATSAGTLAARRVILALGRRGTPRKLGVPGEEAEKVLYRLIDAATYRGAHLLVVGGGDSAVEAATALASQSRNTVTLSYRRAGFFRLKRRNEERIRQFAEEGRVRVLFESAVERIDRETVTLRAREGGVERTHVLRNDQVFVLAGGEPPYELLRKLGIRFHGAEEGGPVTARAGAASSSG